MIHFKLTRKPPSTNGLFANRRGGGGRFVTKRYKDWRFHSQLEVAEQSPDKILEGDVRATYIYGPRRKGADVTNYEKAVGDLVVDCGLLTDDSQIVDCRLVWTEFDDGPKVDGVEVKIELV